MIKKACVNCKWKQAEKETCVDATAEIKYINLAIEMAKLSECKRRKVGAVIVTKNGEVIAGYNHLPVGTDRSICNNCPREEKKHGEWSLTDECPAIHAEQDAILKAARLGYRIVDGTIYVSEEPCNVCARYIKEAGMEIGGSEMKCAFCGKETNDDIPMCRECAEEIEVEVEEQ